MCCLGFNWQYNIIGSDNGFASIRRQAIIWINGGMFYCVTRPLWIDAIYLLTIIAQINDCIQSFSVGCEFLTYI